MYIDRILYPIETLGPGNRLVLWTRGCSKHCKNCANPELWDTSNAKNVKVEDIEQIIINIHNDTPIDGITISGGDPLEQMEEILELVKRVKVMVQDILVYTGYTVSELERNWDKSIIKRMKELISVLIDGAYIEELNDKELSLRGSSNQNIICFDESRKSIYEAYLRKGRKIQNVYMGTRLISVGIHDRKEVK